MLRKIIYLLIVIFLIWLAFATRIHHQWFHPLIVKYGGDTIWAGMFLIFLRIFFSKIKLWKLAIICYLLGVADEVSQLYKVHPFLDNDEPLLGVIEVGSVYRCCGVVF